MSVLFLCTGNSCRSILADAAFNPLAPAGWMLGAHWGVDDPAHAKGSDAALDAAFLRAYRTLRARIEAFLALPLETLKHDRPALKAAMDRIATVTA